MIATGPRPTRTPGGTCAARRLQSRPRPRPGQPSRPDRDAGFAAGLVVGLALVAAAVLGLALFAAQGQPGTPTVAVRPVVVVDHDLVATPTPAWPFRPEWLTPRPPTR